MLDNTIRNSKGVTLNKCYNNADARVCLLVAGVRAGAFSLPEK